MALTTAAKVRTAIVLQGGGALGAYELGVVKALYESRPGFRPSVISGTSIGAVTAAVLAGAPGDPVEALERLWRERLPVPSPVLSGGVDPTGWWPPEARRSLSLTGNPGMYRVRADWLWGPALCTSVYELGPLRATLGQLVDLDILNDGRPRVILGALDIASGKAAYFDTGEERLSLDHVLASGSLPPGFPPTEIGGTAYWDGGLFANTPLSPAINALEQCDDGDRSVVRELIVVELFPMAGDVPHTMADVAERSTQLRYTSRLILDRKFFDKVNDEIALFEAIDEDLPPGSAVRDDETYRARRRHRRIDSFTVVSADFPSELSNASDFSSSSIEARIRAGHQRAMEQGIGMVPTGRRRPARASAR